MEEDFEERVNAFIPVLRPHQREGLSWMLEKERGFLCGSSTNAVDTKERTWTRGGIIADDMGTGKTMQMVALMFLRKRDTLIVTLPSVIAQWRDVVTDVMGTRPWILVRKTLCEAPGGSVSPSVGREKDDPEKDRTCKVAITSYQSLAAHSRTVCNSPKCIFRRKWDRIVLDEGHYIRNAKTNSYKAICRLQNDRVNTEGHKWILSGTPINNSRKDLASLAHWMGLPLLDPDMANEFILRRTMSDITTTRRHSEELVTTSVSPHHHNGKKDKRKSRSSTNDEVDDEKFVSSSFTKKTKKELVTSGSLVGLVTRIVKIPFIYEHEKQIYQLIRQVYGFEEEDVGVLEKRLSDEEPEALTRYQGGEEENRYNGSSSRTDHKKAMECITRLRQICAHSSVLSKGLFIKRSKQRTHGGDCKYSSLFSSGGGGGNTSSIDTTSESGERFDRERTKNLLKTLSSFDSSELRKSTKMDYVIHSLRVFFTDFYRSEGKDTENIRPRMVNPPPKALVFCEWRKEIEVLMMGIKTGGISNAETEVLMFTGDLSLLERASLIRRFENAQTPSVMLVQVKTGGTGLNLQKANKVIITTPGWNPCSDLQAICRAYRQGQNRVVHCERLVIQETVEEQCINVQKRKTDILDELFEEDTFAKRMGFSV